MTQNLAESHICVKRSSMRNDLCKEKSFTDWETAGKIDQPRLSSCVPLQVIKAANTQTISNAARLAAASLPRMTYRLWAQEEMTGLSLISLSSAQTSPNYSHCLPLRWHAYWIIDGRPCPSQLKGLANGHRSSQWTGLLPTKLLLVCLNMTVNMIIIPTSICFYFIVLFFVIFHLVLCTGQGALYLFVCFLAPVGQTCLFCFGLVFFVLFFLIKEKLVNWPLFCICLTYCIWVETKLWEGNISPEFQSSLYI